MTILKNKNIALLPSILVSAFLFSGTPAEELLKKEQYRKEQLQKANTSVNNFPKFLWHMSKIDHLNDDEAKDLKLDVANRKRWVELPRGTEYTVKAVPASLTFLASCGFIGYYPSSDLSTIKTAIFVGALCTAYKTFPWFMDAIVSDEVRINMLKTIEKKQNKK